MGAGFLRIELYAGEHTIPVSNNTVKIMKNGNILYNLTTDKYGVTETVKLTTPDIIMPDTTMQPPPREIYDVEVESDGQYKQMTITDVSIYDGITSILPLQMLPFVAGATDGNALNLSIYPCEPGGRSGLNGQDMDIPVSGHAVMDDKRTSSEYAPDAFARENAEGFNFGNTTPILGNDIALPEYVTVHMGRPSETAQNLRVPFKEYVKNVASSEIYPTWEDAALRANILCQISFVLNRIYTTWYRSRNYNFDITNSTTVDQCFRYNREIYQNIGKIVDEIFNCFLRRTGRREPFFAEYCDGRVAQCSGLKQFGSQDLALRGYTPIQIIHYYYPGDMRINYTNQFFSNIGTYPGQFPGYTLRQGMTGEPIRTMQMYLNSISGRWYIPPISNPNGFFGPETTRTVTDFQRTPQFGLTSVDGLIGRNTWYMITRIFVAERRLALLVSEGHRMSIGVSPPTVTVQMGSEGEAVVELQFILAFIAEFFPTIPLTIQSGIFKENTRQAVLAFQRQYNLTANGVVDSGTWRRLYDVYLSLADDIPLKPELNIPAFPGTSLRQGDTGPNVLLMQNYLNDIALFYPSIQRLNPDGNFGPATANAVREFQRLFGFSVDAVIGPNTWYEIINVRNALVAGGELPELPEPPPQPPYPGTALRQGDFGPNVLLIQNRLIQMRTVFPSIPALTADSSFGPNTRNAVIAFQRIFGLSPDGVVGPLSWNLIMNVSANLPSVTNPAFPGTLRVGMSNNNNVRTVQQYLNTISRNISITSTPLTVDGNFGTRTQQAVASFQRQYGLTGDGVVGPLTWNMLLSVYNAMNMKIAGIVSFDGLGREIGIIAQYMKLYDEMLPQSAFQEGETQGFSSTSGYDTVGQGYRNDYTQQYNAYMPQLFALMFMFMGKAR